MADFVLELTAEQRRLIPILAAEAELTPAEWIRQFVAGFAPDAVITAGGHTAGPVNWDAELANLTGQEGQP